ncbi:enoyl-CoA hydratase/isomerase family protein [Marinicauda pacifica]|uniref:enoyl-CoA hydratase/isomerase family protein n=1 Tax=Marinicauda pacifica TaxID=1133559 RepID=UPI0035C83CC7
MTKAITLETDGRVARLVLDRPDKRNALNEAMWQAIPGLLEQVETDDRVRVLIVTGRGGSFAAGADISEFEDVYATPDRAAAYSRTIARALDALAAVSKPVLARIEGACVGGGYALALACDLRFAALGSRFAITPGKLGLLYPFNDLKRLVDLAGVATAKDLLFTARMVGDKEALALGLIDRLEGPEALDEALAAYIDLICAGSARSARMTKAMLARIAAGQAEDDAETEAMFLDAFSSADFDEGYRAFLEKRKPRF